MKIKSAIKKILDEVYGLLFKKNIQIKLLKEKVDTLQEQLDYLKRHTDVKSVTKATGWLRDYQLKDLEYAQEVIKMLNNNDIHPFLESGGLLGAIRHGGFIPWDDDIDVGVTRQDFNKIIELAKSKYIWIDTTTIKTNFNYYYDQAIKEHPNQYVFLQTPFCIHCYNGTSLLDAQNIEFFVYDYIKDGVTKEQFLKFRAEISKMYYTAHSWKEIFDYYKKVLDEEEIYSKTKTDRLYAGPGSYDLIEMKFNDFRCYDDIFPLKDINFEMTVIPGPNKPEEMVEKQYGPNWCSYPSDVGIAHTFKSLNEYYVSIGKSPLDNDY